MNAQIQSIKTKKNPYTLKNPPQFTVWGKRYKPRCAADLGHRYIEHANSHWSCLEELRTNTPKKTTNHQKVVELKIYTELKTLASETDCNYNSTRRDRYGANESSVPMTVANHRNQHCSIVLPNGSVQPQMKIETRFRITENCPEIWTRNVERTSVR